MECFNLIMDIGEQMLISGAEVHRVEESIKRMCLAFNALRVDVFVITSSMVVTVYMPDGETQTQTRRITTTNINYEKLHKLNELSRQICNRRLSEQEINERLDYAINCKKFSVFFEFICYAVIAASFTAFFGGNISETAISFFIGICVRLGILFCDIIISNKIFVKFFSSFLVSILAFFSVKLGWITNVDKVIIGNVMTLIPGIGLTNALRDLFVGDSVAAILRFVEAILTALAIAAGYFLVAILGGFAL